MLLHVQPLPTLAQPNIALPQYDLFTQLTLLFFPSRRTEKRMHRAGCADTVVVILRLVGMYARVLFVRLTDWSTEEIILKVQYLYLIRYLLVIRHTHV